MNKTPIFSLLQNNNSNPRNSVRADQSELHEPRELPGTERSGQEPELEEHRRRTLPAVYQDAPPPLPPPPLSVEHSKGGVRSERPSRRGRLLLLSPQDVHEESGQIKLQPLLGGVQKGLV